MPLPALQIDGARVQSSLVQLFRRPAVLLEVGRIAGLVEVKQPALDPVQGELGRLVQALRTDGVAPPQAMLTITPTGPRAGRASHSRGLGRRRLEGSGRLPLAAQQGRDRRDRHQRAAALAWPVPG